MPVTPFYVAIFGIILFALSIRTIRVRRRLRIAIGHADDDAMERAMRVHANFCEYVPISLLLIYLLEVTLGTSYWIHVLGGTLLLGRLLHAWGVSRPREDFRFRVTGMVLTFTVIISSALRILLAYAGWFTA